MKITKIDVLQVNTSAPNWRPIFCRIHTDSGIYGDGEAALCYGNAAPGAFGMIKEFATLIIGLDPFDSEAIWEKLYKDTFWGMNGGPVVFAAISALDIALWDIKGKALKTPVHELLGGKCRDKVRCYASQLQYGWPKLFTRNVVEFAATLDDYKRFGRQALDEGFDAVKYDFFSFNLENVRPSRDEHERILHPKFLEMNAQRMAAVRDEVGPLVDIIVENHSRNDAIGGIQLANLLEPYGVMYFEEPNAPSPNTAEYISRNTHIPIASGERIYSRWQYLSYFEKNSLQVIQPDIGNCGGLSEAKKICDMAHTFDVCVQPHICASPFSTSVALHLEAVIPNFLIHEHHVNNRLLSQQYITKYNPQPVDGYLAVPEEPGIGNEITQYAYEHAIAIATIDESQKAVGILPPKDLVNKS